MGILGIRALVPIVIVSIAITTLANIRPPAGVTEWICKLLRIDPKIYSKVSKVRADVVAPANRRAGSRIVHWSISTGKGALLWRCDACWSPAGIGGGRVAVIKADGVWRLDGTNATRITAAENIVALLGTTDGTLVAVRRVESLPEQCNAEVILVSLANGAISTPPEPPPACPDAAALPRPDTLRGQRLLRDSEGVPLTPLVENALTSTVTPLLPASMLEDGLQRFDAIWISDDVVVFLEAS